MTILPAADGDVVDNNGAQFYDQATPDPFKSQVYVHSTNHNFFNRQWSLDDGVTAVLARGTHERVLDVYGSALFRSTLLNDGSEAYLLEEVKPTGIPVHAIDLAYRVKKADTVDHHDDGNTISVNSLGLPTSATAELLRTSSCSTRRPAPLMAASSASQSAWCCLQGSLPGAISGPKLAPSTCARRGVGPRRRSRRGDCRSERCHVRSRSRGCRRHCGLDRIRIGGRRPPTISAARPVQDHAVDAALQPPLHRATQWAELEGDRRSSPALYNWRRTDRSRSTTCNSYPCDHARFGGST